MSEMEYNHNPTEILDGDVIEESWQFCGKCFETITQPILAGIWYHNAEQKNYDHEPVLADTFLQLFLMYEHHGNGVMLKISKSDNRGSLACPCYLKWFNILKKQNVDGFQDSHYFDSSGISACKTFLLDISPHDITKSDYPEKQGYLCKECISELVKRKIIKITPPISKNKNEIYNRITWLKRA